MVQTDLRFQFIYKTNSANDLHKFHKRKVPEHDIHKISNVHLKADQQNRFVSDYN